MPTSFRFETFRTLSPGRELAGEETPKCFEQLFCICETETNYGTVTNFQISLGLVSQNAPNRA